MTCEEVFVGVALSVVTHACAAGNLCYEIRAMANPRRDMCLVLGAANVVLVSCRPSHGVRAMQFVVRVMRDTV